MYKNGSSTVDTLMTGLTWSRLGSVQVGESVVGWMGGPSARRWRLCRLELRCSSSTCRSCTHADCCAEHCKVALAFMATMRTASEPCLQGLTSSIVLKAHRQRCWQGWLLGCLNLLSYPQLRPQSPDVQLCDIASGCTTVRRGWLAPGGSGWWAGCQRRVLLR